MRSQPSHSTSAAWRCSSTLSVAPCTTGLRTQRWSTPGMHGRTSDSWRELLDGRVSVFRTPPLTLLVRHTDVDRGGLEGPGEATPRATSSVGNYYTRSKL